MREITNEDLEMFIAMERLRILSKCIDKQVVCIITDRNNHVLSVGVNTVEACNKDCHNKEARLCVVRHAEVVAVENLSPINRQRAARAYVSLFPCAPCQSVIAPIVDEIVTFGMAHKGWESDKVLVFPHPYYNAMRKESMGKIRLPYETMAEYATYLEFRSDAAEIEAHVRNPEYYEEVRNTRKTIYGRILAPHGLSLAAKTLEDKKLGRI